MKKSSVYNPFRFPYKLSPFQALLTASAQGCYLRMPKSSYLVIRIEVIINKCSEAFQILSIPKFMVFYFKNYNVFSTNRNAVYGKREQVSRKQMGPTQLKPA